MATKRKTTRRKKVDPASRGLSPDEMHDEIPSDLDRLGDQIEGDGGVTLGKYRDPLAGSPLLLAALPVDQVEPTPYQRDLSAAHLKKLTDVLDRVGQYLDPIIATREAAAKYWTPNGNHRLSAMKALGAKSITALVVPNREIAYKILALNTEKSHNLKEKALEVIRMVRALAEDSDRNESEFALEFEEPVLLTLGPCYEQNGRFAGASYRPALLRVERFLDTPLARAVEVREARAGSLLALDAKVTEVIAALKERGIESPYLRPFVTARINPIRFKKDVTDTPEELIDKMLEAARTFDVGKVRPDQISASGGAAATE